MAYIVSSTEKVRGKGADYETKAMLYLMGGREDSFEIYSFAIDFYNDVTGLNVHAEKAWDLQSKGNVAKGPMEIGRELVTLFKNYLSDLTFNYLILFMAGVPDTFRIDSSINTFGIENITEKALKSVRNGLVKEATDKIYIDNDKITDENVDAFLKKVTFVIDDKTKAEYIKHILSLNPKFIPKDAVLEGIFNTIRDAQAAKKNNSSVEGEMVTHLRDVYAYDRTIKAREIRLMVINTLVNRDIVGGGAPRYFFPLIQNYDGIKQGEVIEDCQLQISVALFDKANSDAFWDLLDAIIDAVIDNRKLSTAETYDMISQNDAVRKTLLDVLSIQYLISVMKEALE